MINKIKYKSFKLFKASGYQFSSAYASINCPYSILGVKKGCSFSQIKNNYLKLTKQYHPDLNKEANAEETLKNINNAFDQIKQEYNLNPEQFGTFKTEEEINDFDFKFDYNTVTEEEIYKKIFGKEYHQDPMMMYKEQNIHLRNRFEMERQKMKEAQGNKYREDQDIKDFRNLREEEEIYIKKQKLKNESHLQESLNSTEKKWGIGIISFIGIVGIIIISRKEDGFKGTIKKEQLQNWRQKSLENPKPRLPLKVRPAPRQKDKEEMMRNGDFIYNNTNTWYKAKKVAEVLNARSEDQRYRAQFFNKNQGFYDTGDQGVLYAVLSYD